MTNTTADALVEGGSDTDRDHPARLAEASLVGRAQEGDVVSFEALVRRYQRPVFALAQRMLADRGDAEDAVQDTFLTVWRRLPTLADAGVFRAWVFQIATRRCLNLLRARTRHPAAPTEAAHLEAATDTARPGPSGGSDPASIVERAAQLASLDAVLRTLDEDQRVCWLLREVSGLSYPEIAYITHLPASTVRGRIARARQNLMRGMDAWR